MSIPPLDGLRVGPVGKADSYVLGPVVGAGAEGVLYRGWITTPDGLVLDVAIKMLHSRFQGHVDEWYDRWSELVEVLRCLQIPGVVGVRDGFLGPLPHDPGEAGTERTLYLIMNWVEGEPLDEWVRRRPHRDPFPTLKLLLGVAAALDFMHSGQATGGTPVVHRDVKPSNIMVTDHGTVLVDFGLTRGLPEGQRLSGVSGTPGYLAPEIIKEGIYTEATDRYALGSVAYFLFTGQEPPTSHQPHVLRTQLTAVPALADRLDVVDHLMAMLDSNPEVRPSPLSQWVAQLRSSTLPDLPEPARRRRRKSGGGSRMADLAQRAEDLGSAWSKLTRELVDLDSHDDLVFARAQAASAGRTGQRARDVMAGLDRIWERYPLAKEALEQLDAAVSRGSADEAQRLLGPHALTLPSGAKRSAGALLADLQRELDGVADGVVSLASTSRQAVCHIDAATDAVEHLAERAGTLGAADDAQIIAARRALEEAKVAVAVDPAANDQITKLDDAVDTACQHVEQLERQRDTLPDGLVASRSLLGEIEQLGAERAQTEEKLVVTKPRELLEPDSDDRALRKWLTRIEHEAATVGWRSAAVSLEDWTKVADRHLIDARLISEANRASLEHRNDLRGLLGAYRAKAAAGGRVEDTTLLGLYEDAEKVLWQAPCDLAQAERHVQAYVKAVNINPVKDET